MHHGPQEIPSHPNLILSVFRSLQDTDSLFDFETPITEDVFVANGPAQVFRRKEGEVRLRRTRVVGKRQALNGEMPGFDFEAFLDITTKKSINGSRYFLAPSHPHQPSRLQHSESLDLLPFICLSRHGRTNELTSHPITKDDIIKLGKTCFRVSETHLTRGNRDDDPFQSLDAAFSPADKPEGLACRICLGEGGDDLISPCECRGSCQFVHFSCLQAWIQSKVRREESRMVSVYSLAKLQCELCKTSLPNRMRIAGETHSLVEFEWPSTPFIVLEKLPSAQEAARTFIVLTPRQREVRIGRWPGMDLRVQDITLSRVHSSISFANGNFLLRDEGSRFGSLILLRGQVEVEKLMCLQAGSKIYKVEPHKPQRSLQRLQ